MPRPWAPPGKHLCSPQVEKGVPEALQLEEAEWLWPERELSGDLDLYLTPQAICLSQFFSNLCHRSSTALNLHNDLGTN